MSRHEEYPASVFSVHASARLRTVPSTAICGALFRGCLYAGFADGTVHAWRVGGHQGEGPQVSFDGNVGGVSTMALFEPRTVVIAAADGMISVWGSECGGSRDTDAVVLLRGHSASVQYLEHNGRHIFSVSDDMTLRIWNVCLGAEVHMIRFHSPPQSFAVQACPSGDPPMLFEEHQTVSCAIGCWDGSIVSYSCDLTGGDKPHEEQQRNVLAAHNGPVGGILFRARHDAFGGATHHPASGAERFFVDAVVPEFGIGPILISCGLYDGRVCIWKLTKSSSEPNSASAKSNGDWQLHAQFATRPFASPILSSLVYDWSSHRLLALDNCANTSNPHVLAFDVGAALSIWGQCNPPYQYPAIPTSSNKMSVWALEDRVESWFSNWATYLQATFASRHMFTRSALLGVSCLQFACIAHSLLSSQAGLGIQAGTSLFGENMAYWAWAVQSIGVSTMNYSAAVGVLVTQWIVFVLVCVVRPVMRRVPGATRLQNADAPYRAAMVRSCFLKSLHSLLWGTVRTVVVLGCGIGQLLTIASIRGVVAATRCVPYFTLWSNDTAWQPPVLNDVEIAAAAAAAAAAANATTVSSAPYLSSYFWTCDASDISSEGYFTIESRDACTAAAQFLMPDEALEIANTPEETVAGVDVPGCVVDDSGDLYFHDLPLDRSCQRCSSTLGYIALCVYDPRATTTPVPGPEGCTDPWAYNYDPDAAVNDDSCAYDVMLRVAAPHIECSGSVAAYGVNYAVQTSLLWVVCLFVLLAFQLRLIFATGRVDMLDRAARATRLISKIPQTFVVRPFKSLLRDIISMAETATSRSENDHPKVELPRISASVFMIRNPFNWVSDRVLDEVVQSASKRDSASPNSGSAVVEPSSAPGTSKGALLATPWLSTAFAEQSAVYPVLRLSFVLVVSLLQILVSYPPLLDETHVLNSSIVSQSSTNFEAQVALLGGGEPSWLGLLTPIFFALECAVLVFVGSGTLWWTIRTNHRGTRGEFVCLCRRQQSRKVLPREQGETKTPDSDTTKQGGGFRKGRGWKICQLLLTAGRGRFHSDALNRLALSGDIAVLCGCAVYIAVLVTHLTLSHAEWVRDIGSWTMAQILGWVAPALTLLVSWIVLGRNSSLLRTIQMRKMRAKNKRQSR